SFLRAAHARALCPHSFRTPRSSDLAATSRVYSGGRSDRTVYSSPPIITLTACFLVLTGLLRRRPERSPPHPHSHPLPRRRRSPRSEEHKSEPQSPVDLL